MLGPIESSLGATTWNSTALDRTPAASQSRSSVAETAEQFGEVLKKAIDRVAEVQQQADAAVESFAAGEPVDIATLMVAVERANLTMQLAIQVRNKVLEAYQEIIRMPV